MRTQLLTRFPCRILSPSHHHWQHFSDKNSFVFPYFTYDLYYLVYSSYRTYKEPFKKLNLLALLTAHKVVSTIQS